MGELLGLGRAGARSPSVRAGKPPARPLLRRGRPRGLCDAVHAGAPGRRLVLASRVRVARRSRAIALRGTMRGRNRVRVRHVGVVVRPRRPAGVRPPRSGELARRVRTCLRAVASDRSRAGARWRDHGFSREHRSVLWGLSWRAGTWPPGSSAGSRASNGTWRKLGPTTSVGATSTPRDAGMRLDSSRPRSLRHPETWRARHGCSSGLAR